MNKSELIDYIAEKTDADVSKALVGEIVDLAFKGIRSALQKGEEFRISGFGSFKITRRKESAGRNPRTGEAIIIPAANRVKFTAGKELKEAVNS